MPPQQSPKKRDIMETRQFKYSGTLREVLVTEETDTHLKGIDISKCEPDEKEKILKIAETIDHRNWVGKTEEEAQEGIKKEVDLIRPYFKYFRNFNKSEIKKTDE
jgi:hypothetical protein